MGKETVKLDIFLFHKVPDKFLTVEMCEKAVQGHYWCIEYVPNQLKMAEMCNGMAKGEASFLACVPDRYKTQEICKQPVKIYPYALDYVPEHFKTQEMCDKGVQKEPWSLIYAPDWFVTHQKILQVMKSIIGMRCVFLNNNDRLIKWHNDYQKWKTQRAQIKEELFPVAWHPSRYWDWCMSEDEKREMKKLFLTTWFEFCP